MTTLTSQQLQVLQDGASKPLTPEATDLIKTLRLNHPGVVRWRWRWTQIISDAQQRNPLLYRDLMGFPEDLPDLSQLRPPEGNARPEGLEQSYFAKRQRGELPDTY